MSNLICPNYFMEYNGVEIVELDAEHVLLKVEITNNSKNPYGYVHGGLMFTLADCAGGFLTRADGGDYVTLNSEISFIKNVKEGTLLAEGRLLSKGRKIAIVEVTIRNEENILLCKASVTMYHLD